MLLSALYDFVLTLIPLLVVSISVASVALLLAAMLVSRPDPLLHPTKQPVRR